MAGRQRDERHLRGSGDRSEPRRAEEDGSRLERDEDGDRDEHRRFVLDDERRIDARNLRDGGKKRVPERERVSGMQPASRQLVESPGRERAELDELPDAREVERRVSCERSRGNVPEEHSEHEPGESHGVPSPDRRLFGTLSAPAEHERREPEHEQNDEREPERPVKHEDKCERDGERAERPRDRCGRRPEAERPGDQPAGQQHDEGRQAEPDEQPDTVLREQPRQSECRK